MMEGGHGQTKLGALNRSCILYTSTNQVFSLKSCSFIVRLIIGIKGISWWSLRLHQSHWPSPNHSQIKVKYIAYRDIYWANILLVCMPGRALINVIIADCVYNLICIIHVYDLYICVYHVLLRNACNILGWMGCYNFPPLRLTPPL